MAGRSTQGIIASLSIRNAAYVRVTQNVVTALIINQHSDRPAHATQNVLAGLIIKQSPVRATQTVVEVLYQRAMVNAPPEIYPILLSPGAPSQAVDGSGGSGLPYLSYSVIKRPKFSSGISIAATGREVRVAYAAYPLWEWDLNYDYLPDPGGIGDDLWALFGLYLSRLGAALGFLFQDIDDHIVSGQYVAVADGVTTNFLLYRTYGGGDGNASEPIGYVDLNAPFSVYFDGALVSPAGYSVITKTPLAQRLKFPVAPASGVTITVSMSYFYYVRFKDDEIAFEKFLDRLWSAATLTLMSQRRGS
jgi:hypothetical protein